MDTLGQTATKPADPDLEAIREALTGHNAKPFLVVTADTGKPLNWYDAEAHAFDAARFASIQGVAHVVYRAIGIVEPVKGITSLVTKVGVPQREAANA